jgi:hypothetical protein
MKIVKERGKEERGWEEIRGGNENERKNYGRGEKLRGIMRKKEIFMSLPLAELFGKAPLR